MGAALDEGINWIDTAAAYGLGHSEQVLAKALRQTSGKPFVATKCGLVPAGDGKIVPCLTSESISAECEASLKRLGVDVIDLYQIHWPDPNADLAKAWAQMAKLVQKGKVRYVGVSNFSIEQMEQLQNIHPIASSQPPYSMLHREVEDGHLAFCAQNNIGVVVYSPMQRGLLTGKFTQERLAGLPLDDHRRRSPDFHEPQFSATLELVEKLQPIAERNGHSLGASSGRTHFCHSRHQKTRPDKGNGSRWGLDLGFRRH